MGMVRDEDRCPTVRTSSGPLPEGKECPARFCRRTNSAWSVLPSALMHFLSLHRARYPNFWELCLWSGQQLICANHRVE